MTDLQSEILAGTSYQDVPPFAKLYLKGLGASEEKERIIKMLEEHKPEVSPDSGFVGCECGATDGIWPLWYDKHLSALIKGEK